MMCVAVVMPAAGQNIKDHYVSKVDDSGTIYHTFPVSLFEASRGEELTFDMTYRTNGDGMATINFSYEKDGTLPTDSVHFISGRTGMRGVAKKLYVTAEKKLWKHRYSVSVDVKALYAFFDAAATPQVVLYEQGEACVYLVKPSAWRSTAPVMNKIFQMIRINEQH